MRLILTLEYDGTPFHGWAAQPGLPTVEAALRAALAGTFESVEQLAVAGRTDTGVHALGQVVSVEVGGGPPPERAAAALERGWGDLVSFARLLLANPDLPTRFARGAPLNAPDRSTFYGGDERGYTDYPTLDALPVRG